MRLIPSAVLILLALVGSAAAGDLPEIQKSGILRVLAVDGTPAFFNVKQTGRPGLEREILDGFARLHNLVVMPVEVTSWEDLLPALIAGRGDVVAGGVTVTEPRRKLVDFTAEVFPTRNVVISRKPHRVVATLEELRKEKVGTIRGTSLADAVVEAGVPAANVDDSVPATGFDEPLRSGRITVAIDGVEDALLLQQVDPQLQIGVFVGAPGSLAFGVRKSDTRLRQALDAHLSNVRRSTTWNRLVVDYFGSAALKVLQQARSK